MSDDKFHFRTWWPMGCKKIKNQDEFEKLIQNSKYIAQEKIDGVRCVLQAEGLGGEIQFTTRGASISEPNKTIDITHRLGHLWYFAKYLPHGVTLDGELYSSNLTSAQVSGMVNFRSTVNVDPSIKFYAFDILTWGGVDITSLPWSSRMQHLRFIGNIPNLLEGLVIVPYVVSPEDKLSLYERELRGGREGIVLKNITAPYKTREGETLKPTGIWYKMKAKDTIDVTITGSELPATFYRDPDTGVEDIDRTTKFYDRGWFGSIKFEFIDKKGRKITGSCSGIEDTLRDQMSDGNWHILPEYIGRKMEVEYMEASKDGILRHPRFIRIIEEGEK